MAERKEVAPPVVYLQRAHRVSAIQQLKEGHDRSSPRFLMRLRFGDTCALGCLPLAAQALRGPSWRANLITECSCRAISHGHYRMKGKAGTVRASSLHARPQ